MIRTPLCAYIVNFHSLQWHTSVNQPHLKRVQPRDAVRYLQMKIKWKLWHAMIGQGQPQLGQEQINNSVATHLHQCVARMLLPIGFHCLEAKLHSWASADPCHSVAWLCVKELYLWATVPEWQRCWRSSNATALSSQTMQELRQVGHGAMVCLCPYSWATLWCGSVKTQKLQCRCHSVMDTKSLLCFWPYCSCHGF